MAGTVRLRDPGRPGEQPGERDRLAVVTQWTYESITVVTTGWDESGGEQTRLTRPAGARLPALPAPPGRALRVPRRGGRLARAAFVAAGLVALPILARPVQQLLLGRRDLPRLPRPEVPLLPPAGEGE